MNWRYLLLLALWSTLLSACSQTVGASHAEIDSPQVPTRAVDREPTPTDDPIVKGIRISFAAGAHAAQVSCETCHASAAGVLQKDLSWFNEATGQSEPCSLPHEICVKCHVSQELPGLIASGIQAAHPDYDCMSCHNAHNPQASCTQSACHTDIRDLINAQVERPEGHPTEGDPSSYMCGGTACHDLSRQALAAPIYHQPTHRQVPCYVCHDSSGMAVVQDTDQLWITLAEPAPGGGNQAAVISHVIGREVVCQKCHAYKNAWNLIEIIPQN